MRGYQKLLVWKEAMAMARTMYILVRAFPKDEQSALGQELRHAALMVPYNIARGHQRRRAGDLLRCVIAALDSAAEIETLLILSSELGYISVPELKDAQTALDEVVQNLEGMRAALSAKANDPKRERRTGQAEV
ncbi:four helix bundle protein [Candidatus Fermentibacterales bacterium]|nr:four helix bundle protein [Candidatus Fermentibacterales bacterium]